MRILALVPSVHDTSPGQRFRLEQWAPLLEAHGVQIDYQPFETDDLHALLYKPGAYFDKVKLILKAINRRLRLLRSLDRYDAVYVFREAAVLGPAVFERLIHRSGVPMIFDFDDAIFVPYVSPSNGYLSYLKFPSKTETICKLASHVIAGNKYLADYASRVNNNVSIVPTTIDTISYTIAEKPAGDPVVIGWSGSYSTVQHLETVRAALLKLACTHRFRLKVIGSPRFDLAGVEVEASAWRAESEVADLRQIDIGIMPLPDDQWTRGKCGLKALQYMALGIPTVCSPVGVNSDIISDGENGLLAASEDEWIAKLASLLESASLRERLGRAGRLTVEQEYSAAVQAPRVYNIIESVVRGAVATAHALGDSGIANPAG